MALDDLVEQYRSEIVFTPFRGADLDAPKVASLVDGWLSLAGLPAGEIFGGGAIIALGRGGSVLRTGCLFVGARHIEVVPGT